MKINVFLYLIIGILFSSIPLSAGKNQKRNRQEKNGFPDQQLAKQLFTLAPRQVPNTTIHHAATNGDLAGVQSFLNSKPDLINDRDRNGRAPLHYAAGFGHENIVKFLLRYKANPNLRDREGKTPLYWASGKGHINAARLLLAAHADPNILDNANETALHWAAINGCPKIVKILLEYNANPNIQDADKKRTALHWVFRMSRAGIEKKGEQLPIETVAKIFNILVCHGAKTNVRDFWNGTVEDWLLESYKLGRLKDADIKLLQITLNQQSDLSPDEFNLLKVQVMKNDIAWLKKRMIQLKTCIRDLNSYPTNVERFHSV